MASDLKIEIFAYTLFHKTWLQMGMVKTKPDIIQIYGEECCKVERIYEASDDLYIIPVICRRTLFKDIYLKDFTEETVGSLNSLTDCYNYIINKCDGNDLFGNLTVFEKMFATCCFVLDFCIRIHQYNVIDVAEYGHLLWAMYFDKFTNEFYKKGGWLRLKSTAETYQTLDDFFCLFKNAPIFEIEEAKDDYFSFLFSDLYHESTKINRKKIYITKVWVKFRIEQLDKYIRTSLFYHDPFQVIEVEELLEELKEIVEIISEVNEFTNIENSETPDHSENKTNTDDYLSIEHFIERKCQLPNASPEDKSANEVHESLIYRKPPLYNILDTTKFNSEIPSDRADNRTDTDDLRIEHFIESKYEFAEAFEDQSANKVHKTLVYRKPPPYDPDVTMSHSEIPTEHHVDNRTNTDEDLRTAHLTEKKYEFSNASGDQSANKVYESLIYRKHPPYNILDTTKFHSKTLADITDDLRIEPFTERKYEIPNASEDQSANNVHESLVYRKPLYYVPDTTIFHSEISTEHQLDNRTNTHEDPRTEHFTERKCEFPNASNVHLANKVHESLVYRKPPLYNAPDATIFYSENGSASSSTEINTEETLEKSSSKNGSNREKTDNKTRSKTISYKSESECSGKIDNLYSLNIQRQYETLNAPVLTEKQMDKSLSDGLHSRKVPKMLNICSPNATVSDNEEVSKKNLEVTHSQNEVDLTEISKRTDILSANQMSSSQLEETSHILSKRQVADPYIDNLHSRNTDALSVCLSEVLSEIQMAESECDEKITSDVFPASKVLDLINQFENTFSIISLKTGNEIKKGL